MEIYRGNQQQIGQQIGEYYKSQGVRLPHQEIDIELLDRQKAVYKQYYPSYLEQLTATAKTAGFDLNRFLYSRIGISVKDFANINGVTQRGCTVFGVQNCAGTFVGRNYDWFPGTEDYARGYKAFGSDSYGYIGLSDMDYETAGDAQNGHLFYGTEDAINDQGLYIGLTYAYHEGVQNGLVPTHLLQLVAETCTTTEQAVETLKKTPLAIPKNYFIADAKGDMVVVEHAVTKIKLLKPVDGVLVQTNHYIDPELAKEDIVLTRNPATTSFKRYKAALNQLDLHKTDINQAGLIEVIQNPDVIENDASMKTIWSLTMDMMGKSYNLRRNHFNEPKDEKLTF